MAALEEHESFMREFLSKKENTLADVLKTTYPDQRVFSSRSIKEKGIKCRGIFSNEQLDDAVRVKSLR